MRIAIYYCVDSDCEIILVQSKYINANTHYIRVTEFVDVDLPRLPDADELIAYSKRAVIHASITRMLEARGD